MAGQVLRIRRPRDYVADPKEAANFFFAGAMHDSPEKIFVGGLPSYLTESQVQELLTSFGELKIFNLVMDNITGISKVPFEFFLVISYIYIGICFLRIYGS